MRRYSLAATVLWLAACEPPTPAPQQGGDEQQRALADLEAETGVPWTVRYHPALHTPAFLDGRTRPMVARTTETPGAARAFFRAHRALYRMTAPDDELELDRAEGDELG